MGKQKDSALLDDWQVVELGDSLTLSVSGRVFAELGAKVLHIGTPRTGLLAQYLDEGKQFASPENASPALDGAAVILTDAPDHPALADREPDQHTIVHVTPFGLTGPDAGIPATDLTLFCASGIAHLLTGQVTDVAEPPTKAAGEQSAFVGGVAAASVAVLAELGRRRGAPTAPIDLAVHDALATLAIQELAHASASGHARSRKRVGDGNGSTVCILPASDGYTAISPREEAQWRRWLEVMGNPAWGDDPRFATKPGRAANWDEVHGSMSTWSVTQTKQAIADAAQAAHVPSFPLCAPHEHLDLAQLEDRRFFRTTSVQSGDNDIEVRVPTTPFGITRLPAKSGGPSRNAPDPNRGPLGGVRVLDFSWVIAGPTTTRYLAAMGADIIKVEAPGRGDPGRTSELHTVLGQDKQAIVLDLKSDDGRRLARELALQSDVVVENFATGVMERFGLGAAELHELHPSLVYVSASGMGRTGPQAKAVAYGTLLQCFSGFAGLNIGPGIAPRVGMAWLDPMCGLMLALITGAALNDVNARGGGVRIDFSMVEAMLWTMAGPLLEGQTPTGEALAGPYPEGVYPLSGDDKWVGLSVTSDLQWDALCQSIGDEFEPFIGHSYEARRENATTLNNALARWTERTPLPTILAVCDKAGVPVSPVADAVDLIDRPQLKARGFWEPSPPTSEHRAPTPGLPWTTGRTPNRQPAAAPAVGADTRAVLSEVLGLTSDELDRLGDAGVFG